MRHKKRLLYLELIFWVVIFLIFLIFTKRVTNRKPNVILITLDAVRSDYLGCYGNPFIQTPNIDELAKNGAIFTNAFTTMPLTNPALASLFTSTYPRVHGVLTCAWGLNTTLPVLAEILKKKGYRCAGFISVRHIGSKFGFARGFDFFYEEFPDSVWELDAKTVTDKAIHWLKENHSKCFFIWIHYFDPHTPYQPPPPYDEFYTREKDIKFRATGEEVRAIEEGRLKLTYREVEYLKALYAGEISYVDNQIGRLLEELRKYKLIPEKTIIVVLSDHGESFEHNRLFVHETALYDGIVRIPLIFYYPPKIPANKKLDNLVQNIDVTPTILHLLNYEVKYPTFQGKSLLPLLLKSEKFSSLSTDDETVYIERRAFTNEYTTREQAIKRQIVPGLTFAIRTRSWKYIWSKEGTSELYNLVADPGETKNVVMEKPEIAEQLKNKLFVWLKNNSKKKMCMPVFQKYDPEMIERLRSLGYIQ